MTKKRSGTIDKLGTHLCHRIFVNDGHPRDREMLSTAFIIAYETLSYIQAIGRMSKDKQYDALIKERLKNIKDVLDGKLAIRYGQEVKLTDGAPPN